MKFECPSCGKKYSLPDEKVPAGKDFKVKCKKCGEVIVLRGGLGEDVGQEAAAAPVAPPQAEGFGPEEQPTRVFDYSKMASDGSPLPDLNAGFGAAQAGAFQAAAAPQAAAPAPAAKKAPVASDGIEWFVAVDGEQIGPYETAQMKEMLAAGQITKETFIWRDGFDDWLILNDVPLFSAKGAEGRAPAFAPKAASPGSPFAISGGGASRGQDLFATAGSESADSPFGGGGGGGAAVVSSTGASTDMVQSPRVDAAQLKGARHENSVLFSLSSLQALASSSRDPSPGTHGAIGAATSAGGSGLIDIRSLTAGASSPKPMGGGAPSDDILSIGGPGIGAPMGVPSLLQPVKKEPSKLPYILGGVGGLVVIALSVVLVVILMGGKKDQPTVDEEALRKQILAELMKSNPQLSAEEAEKQAKAAAAAQLGSTGDPKGSEGETATSADPATEEGKKGPGKKGPGKKKTGEEGADDQGSAVAASSEKADPGSKKPTAAEDDLMALIGKAAKKDPAATKEPGKEPSKTPTKEPAKETAAASGLAEKPTKAEVMDSLKSVTPAVNSCGKGQTGVATVSINIAGATGSVASAKVVSGPFAGTPAAGCIESAVKKAKFPKFSQTKFSVSYPFVIK